MYASVEDVDFLVGCLAESPRPEGYLISETAFYVFIMNASRRLLCDRFYQAGRNFSHDMACSDDVGTGVVYSQKLGQDPSAIPSNEILFDATKLCARFNLAGDGQCSLRSVIK